MRGTQPAMRGQAGFTLIEVVVGAAIGAVLLWCVLTFANRTIFGEEALGERLQASAGAAHALERMSSEAASALAVYVPASDAFGNANGDGHEIDFFTRDASHRPFAWAYDFNASSRTLTRYGLGGSAPAAGETISGIDAFSATPATVNDLDNASSPAYDPLFAGANAIDVPYAFTDMPGAIGGNRLVVLQITASGVERRETLASPDAPTSFTVVVTYTPSPAPVVTATPAPLTLVP